MLTRLMDVTDSDPAHMSGTVRESNRFESQLTFVCASGFGVCVAAASQMRLISCNDTNLRQK